MFEERKCVICETAFAPKRAKSVTCSKRCYKKLSYKKAKTYNKECIVCGKSFETKGKNTKICSVGCINTYAKKPDIVKNCEWCNEKFTTSYIKREKRFCSQSCSSKCTNSKRDNKEIGKKISKILKTKYASGEMRHPFLDRKHTDSTKNKISNTRINNKLSVGENNPMFGKNHSIESREKMSDTRTKKILNGEYSSWFSKGRYYSDKLKREVSYRSMLEKQVYQLLDSDERVQTYSEEPCRIQYRMKNEDNNRYYIPDLLISYKNGKQKIVEVKPSNLITEEMNVAKFKAAESYCAERSWTFEVWTENTILDYLSLEG